MIPGRRVSVAALLLLGAIGVATTARLAAQATAAADPRANIVVVLTDDQTLAEMAALPRTNALLGGGGINFTNAYVSYPLCCPSRTTLLTGQYMHNHNVRGNHLPFGGWERFRDLGGEARALPVWLQSAGYHTVQVGKYLNGYPSIDPPIPAGWDEWYGKLSEYSPSLFGNQVYFNFRLVEQGPDGPPAKIVAYGQSEADYQTDVLRDKAVDAIHRLGGPSGGSEPFFIDLWLSAPHAPYLSATRHVGAFGGAAVPHKRVFNEKDVSDKPKFIRRLDPLSKRKIRSIDQRQRNRWGQLLAVDETVAAITEALAAVDELDNTYIVFTSDNGYLAGDHRIPQGKYLPYEGSAHVPLLLRGPGIPPGSRSAELVSNIDLAPTFAAIAGTPPQLAVDGRSLLPFAQNPAAISARPLLFEGDTGVNLTGGDAIEAGVRDAPLSRRAGVANLEQEPIAQMAKPTRAPAYRAIRTARYLYVRYRGGGAELYDMLTDPLQLRSRQTDSRYSPIKKWLQANLAVLEACAGIGCSAGVGTEPVPRKRRSKQAEEKPKPDKGG